MLESINPMVGGWCSMSVIIAVQGVNRHCLNIFCGQFMSSPMWDTKWENAIPALRERTGETRLTQMR